MSDRVAELMAATIAEIEASTGALDWGHVRRKARRLALRRLALRAGTTAVMVSLAVLVATPAFGLRGRLVQLFASGEPAPAKVVADFAQLDVAAPSGMAPDVIASEAREVMDVPLTTGKNAILWVAPTRSGGFCLGLSMNGRGSGDAGGCDRDRVGRFAPGLSIPGPISSDGRILEPPVVIDGHTLIPSAAKVEVRFEDGAVAETAIVWVSEPIDAGFFIYEVPQDHWEAGHRPVSLLLEDGDGRELARSKSYLNESLQRMTGSDPRTAAPREALAFQRRKLIEVTTAQGTREALWVAPRRDGGRCEWLTSDGHPGRESSCPPPSQMPPDEIAAGLLAGSAPILLEGELGVDVATLELHYQDGDVERLRPVEGFVLAEITSRHWPLGHRLEELVALDAHGAVVARHRLDPDTPGTYPCAKPIVVHAGMTACP